MASKGLNKKQKKELKKTMSKRPVKIFIIILLIIITVVIAFLGYSYFNTQKALEKSTVQITYIEEKTTNTSITASILVEGSNVDFYDISILNEDTNESKAVYENLESFGVDKEYEFAGLKANTDYIVYVTIYKALIKINLYNVGIDVEASNCIKTLKNVATETETGVIYEDFQMHFLELGNKYTGDSTYIKAGDIDILIDAGSRQSSAVAIKEYVDKYCDDGKLEYVITTHAHQDHFAGMFGTKSGSTYNGIMYEYEIGTIIDFALSDSTSNMATVTYPAAVAHAVSNGATHYTAAQCFNNEDGAQRSYEITDKVTMNILYNYYYFNSAEGTSGEENNYSVCTLFTYEGEDSTHNFLLTGDLEIEGEEKMAEYYDGSTLEKTLPHCDLFKAGHHGSKTSSNECLLDLITPDICTVCCCAGSTEYTNNYNNIFPTQDFITRIAKYTDQVYVTSVFNEETLEFESLNGTIIVSCGIDISSNKTAVGLSFSASDVKLKDSDWFNDEIYVIDDCICSGKGKDDFYSSETEGAVLRVRRIWPE